MAQVIQIPVKKMPDGEIWLNLEAVLGKRVILRAHKIDLKQNVRDYDGHRVPEAHAKSSVRCKPKGFKITDNIFDI